MEQLTGRVTYIRFRDAVSTFTIADIVDEEKGSEYTVKGDMPTVYVDRTYRFWGELEHNPRWGNQLKCVGYQDLDDYASSLDSLSRFLGSGAVKHVGSYLAARIVGKFDENTLYVLENEPERLQEIKGIGPETAVKIAKAWKEVSNMHKLVSWFTDAGQSVKLAMRAWEEWGTGAIAKLTEDPYALIELPGVGFEMADKVALAKGIQKDDPRRMAAGVNHVLKQGCQQTGSTYMSLFDALDQISRSLLAATDNIMDDDALDAHKILMEQAQKGYVIVDGDRIFPASLRRAEERVAERLLKIARTPARVNPQNLYMADPQKLGELFGFDLDESQIEAVEHAMNSKVTVLTGGPGTGKTTIVKAIVSESQRLGNTVMLLAPTGRASKQIKLSTGYDGQTIHRALGFNGNDFQTEVLDASVIIVDETSMVDIALMRHLLDAVRDDARIVFVGDVDQLPPVAPGAPFRDIMESNHVTTCRLNVIHRQDRDSAIVQNAQAINAGRADDLVFSPDCGFFFVSAATMADVDARITELVTERVPKHMGDKPYDIMVLAPKKGDMSRKQTAGCVHGLNNALREALNPDAGGAKLGPFRVGDRVMQIKNDYERLVFNGDMGVVTQITPDGDMYVRFDDEQGVQIYSGPEANALVYAWAMTVHKSQGGGYNVVVMAIHDEHNPMLYRTILYTGVTRAKDMVILVGTRRAIRRAITTPAPYIRRTSLAELV